MTHLSQLLGRVAGGEKILIVKGGKPLARLFCSQSIITEGIDELDTGFLEVAAVSGNNRQIVEQGSGGDEAVLDRHSATRCAETCDQFCPA